MKTLRPATVALLERKDQQNRELHQSIVVLEALTAALAERVEILEARELLSRRLPALLG